METLITTEKIFKHSVDKYQFKEFSDDGLVHSNIAKSTDNHDSFQSVPTTTIEEFNGIELTNGNELAEFLLKKTDEMASSFIKLQMKLESQEQEFKKKLEIERKESYQKGRLEVKKEIDSKLEANKIVVIEEFLESIKLLEKSSNEYKLALESIKKKILESTLDIVQEVIKVELSSNSSKVAYTLAHELIKDLQNASKIKLKVNPNDYKLLLEKIETLGNVEIISDEEVTRGGVVAISDVGNIDAQISNRYERVKQAVLQED